MATCDVCGNEYAKAFSVTTSDGQQFTFDSIECAVGKIAPECAHCGCRVLGHGVQDGDTVYCCAHCARESGVDAVADNTASTA